MQGLRCGGNFKHHRFFPDLINPQSVILKGLSVFKSIGHSARPLDSFTTLNLFVMELCELQAEQVQSAAICKFFQHEFIHA